MKLRRISLLLFAVVTLSACGGTEPTASNNVEVETETVTETETAVMESEVTEAEVVTTETMETELLEVETETVTVTEIQESKELQEQAEQTRQDLAEQGVPEDEIDNYVGENGGGMMYVTPDMVNQEMSNTSLVEAAGNLTQEQLEMGNKDLY